VSIDNVHGKVVYNNSNQVDREHEECIKLSSCVKAVLREKECIKCGQMGCRMRGVSLKRRMKLTSETYL